MDQAVNKSWKLPSMTVTVAALILLQIYVIQPSASSWYARQESIPSGYAVLAGEFATLPERVQDGIRNRLRKGYLTNEDVWESVSKIADVRPVQVNPAPDYGDERGTFNDTLWLAISGESLKSNAKDALISQAQRWKQVE